MSRRERAHDAQPWLAGLFLVALAVNTFVDRGAAEPSVVLGAVASPAAGDSTVAGIAVSADSTATPAPPWYGRRRFWIIAGAVAVAVVAVTLVATGDETEAPGPLPGFPPPPR